MDRLELSIGVYAMALFVLSFGDALAEERSRS
jgi:hypothetical protein